VGVNILLITLDQFRADCLSAAGHPVVLTPNLDRLAREGVRLARHYSQAAPCAPGRASLYTGLYQMNHRVVANGTPLDRRFDNIAKAARRAGYAPTLFGYTDQAVDPRDASGPDDPRLSTYEGVLPGFEAGLVWGTGAPGAWLEWLRALGHDVPDDDADAALEGEPGRPADHSLSAYHTDAFLAWLDRREAPWFAHLSQLRPHPPYAAAGAFATLYDPAVLAPPIAAAEPRHRLHDGLLRSPHMAAPADPAGMARLQAQYLGMVSEADHQLGRVWAAIEARGEWQDTFIVVTADHGEQLGDHGLIGKGGFFEQSYHVVGLIRDPRPGAAEGIVVDAFTENVDIFPTLCEAMGIEVPAQCDGASLTPFLAGRTPDDWRDAAHWEFDWRAGLIQKAASDPRVSPVDGRLERRNLAVRRTKDSAYAHFADGSWLCFHLAADPTWRTPQTDPAVVLEQAQALLTWRARHADRTLTGMLVERGGVGRWPEMPSDWGDRNHAAA
jgi:arylsulfatase A-like enzyme